MVATVEQGEALADLIWPEFVEDGGAVFLRLGRLTPTEPLEYLGDLVAAESFVNHVHVLDEFEHDAGLDEEPFWNAEHPDFIRAVRIANVMAEAWAARLAARFPERDFAVYATRDDNPTVRFHTIRATLPFWLDPGDLDELGVGAVLMIVVAKGQISQRLGSLTTNPG
jgi:hypothetical protein